MIKDYSKITKYLFLNTVVKKADFIFVFGTRHFALPVQKAAWLYKNGYSNKILVSGGINKFNGINESQVLKNELIRSGVEADDIWTEDKSTNTLENVTFSVGVIDRKIGLDKVRAVLAIVKNYHSRRALMTLRRYLPDGVKLYPVSYDDSGFTKNNWQDTEKGRDRVLGEYEKIKQYLQKGDIAEIGS